MEDVVDCSEYLHLKVCDQRGSNARGRARSPTLG